jgi:hypothetical protein
MICGVTPVPDSASEGCRRSAFKDQTEVKRLSEATRWPHKRRTEIGKITWYVIIIMITEDNFKCTYCGCDQSDF